MQENKKIAALKELDFSFSKENPVFKGLSVEFGEAESPVMILGSSGSGKTTLLNLIAGLRKPLAGEINAPFDSVSMVFQETRLLPWKTVQENVSLPLTRTLSKSDAGEKALYYLKLVSLEDRAGAYPAELSGGQKQRVNLARAFACPGQLLLMDEPFQSLDLPLRIELMDLTLSLLAAAGTETNYRPFPALIVSHDPREAVYMGKRIVVLGPKPQGIIFDEAVDLSSEERAYGSAAHACMERKILDVLHSSYFNTKRTG